MLTNKEAIEITLEMLRAEDPARRCFGAKTLGGIGRATNGHVQEGVLRALEAVKNTDSDPEVKRLAERSIREINGEFDKTWEKYNPPEPLGSLSDQYYLKRG